MLRLPVLLFLAWTCFLFLAAIGLFTSGFLLTRVELDHHSACLDLPAGRLGGSQAPHLSCWLPRRFPRAVLVIIDALKFEFAHYNPSRREPRAFENKLKILHHLASQQPRHGRLYRFRADPPTTTMQRIKGFTTGSLPTFIDAGSNFASYAIQEDNLVWQLAQNGRRVVFMGDDTWDGLFPRAFHRSYFFPSFNVKDLHTVDDGILQHLYQTVDGGQWDLLIAHFLGVDHCGHKHGPDHPEMAKKLSQMDAMLSSLVDHLANDTLLLVAGDHGMTTTGDHGGDSEAEVNAALFVYSKAPLFHSSPPEEPETVPQVNLVPTLALLLGVPVPYSNIGEVIVDLFAVKGEAAASSLAQLATYRVNAWQVDRFLRSYSLVAQDLPAEKLQRLQRLFLSAVEDHERLLAGSGSPGLRQLEALQGRFQLYLREARAVCAESWARFHPLRMAAGCALLASSCLLCWVACRAASGLGFSYRRLLVYPLLWGAAGAVWPGLAGADLLLVSSWGTAASQLGFFWHFWAGRSRRGYSARSPALFLGARLGPALPLGTLLLRCCAVFSDSFVVAEDHVAPFLLASLVLALALSLHWQGGLDGALLGLLGGVLACVRLSGLFRKCREETPNCRSSLLLDPLSSLQDPQAKNLCFLLCLAGLAGLAWGVRRWLRHYGNLNSPVLPVLFVRWGFPLLALWIGGYWAVTSGAEEAVAKLQAWVQLALVAFPRGVFALVLAGLLSVLWDPVMVLVRDGRETPGADAPIASPGSEAELLQVIPQLYRRMQESWRSRCLDEAKAGRRGHTVAAYGLGSVYSAALLICLALLGFFLLTLHRECLSLAFFLLFLQAFALLWILTFTSSTAAATQAEAFEVPWDAVVAWSLAATQFFYATGHQAVFPTIHWNAAFVGFQEGHGTHLLPALLVGANTFASHILFAGSRLPFAPTVAFSLRSARCPGQEEEAQEGPWQSGGRGADDGDEAPGRPREVLSSPPAAGTQVSVGPRSPVALLKASVGWLEPEGATAADLPSETAGAKLGGKEKRSESDVNQARQESGLSAKPLWVAPPGQTEVGIPCSPRGGHWLGKKEHSHLFSCSTKERKGPALPKNPKEKRSF